MIKTRNSSLIVAFLLMFASLFISSGFFAQESRRARPIKVACVGDSITFGAGLKSWRKDSYPAVLDRLLGDGYKVGNFGVDGRTALRKSRSAYWKMKQFQMAIAYKPHIVVIKFGTNDSKPVNWQYKDEFEKDYGDLVDVFLNLPSHPKVYICQPVPVFSKNYTVSDSVIANEIIPIIEKVGKAKKIKVIELYKTFSGKEELFHDGLHLNEEGCAFLAKEVYKAITGKEVIGRDVASSPSGRLNN